MRAALRILAFGYLPTMEQLSKDDKLVVDKNRGPVHLRNYEDYYDLVQDLMKKKIWFWIGVALAFSGIAIGIVVTSNNIPKTDIEITLFCFLVTLATTPVGFILMIDNLRGLTAKKKYPLEVARIKNWKPIRQRLISNGVAYALVDGLFPRDYSVVDPEETNRQHLKIAETVKDAFDLNVYSYRIQLAFHNVLTELAEKAIAADIKSDLEEKGRIIKDSINPIIQVRLDHFHYHTDKGQLYHQAELQIRSKKKKEEE